MCIGLSTPLPSKTTPMFFSPISPPPHPSLKSANCPSLLLYWFFVNPPKNWIFSVNPHNIKIFHLLPYLLKVTKFLVKISHFKSFVMIEKNIFVYELFSSLNILDFNYVLCKNCTPPPEKSHPLFPNNLRLKIEILSNPSS